MDAIIPRDWFSMASQETLEDFALKRLNHAANLEKEARSIQHEAWQLSIAAGVAQWLARNTDESERLRILRSNLQNADSFTDGTQQADVRQIGERPSVLNGVINRRNGNAA